MPSRKDDQTTIEFEYVPDVSAQVDVLMRLLAPPAGADLRAKEARHPNMSRKPAGVRLASLDGAHLEWTDPVLTVALDALGSHYGLMIDCQFGGVPLVHWLAPEPGTSRRYTFRDVPFYWASEGDALAALEAYRAQQSAAD